MQKDQEFSRAFNSDEPITDEVAGNAVSESAPEGSSDAGSSAVVIDAKSAVDNAAEDAGINTEGAAPTGGEAGEAVEGAQGDVATEAEAEGESVAEEAGEQGAMSPEDIQRQKSWEGRLKKREEELAAREAAVGGNGQPGEADPDEAEITGIKQKLTDDFGEDFVGMISKLAAYEARKLAASGLDEKLNPIHQTIAQAINDVHEAFQNMHFSAIADAHENFEQIINSPEFDTYLKSLPTEQQAAAAAVLDNGTPKQVIKLLTDYQNSLEQGAGNAGPDASVDDALDAAEGVRGSAPVQLPERVPTGSDDEYKAAWDAM